MKDFISDIVVRFSSRKFLLALLGVAVAFGANVSDGQLAAITALIVAFTVVEGAGDYADRNKVDIKWEDTL